MQKKFKFSFRVTQKNMNSVRNNIFGAKTQFNIKGLYPSDDTLSGHYAKKSLNNLRNFIVNSKPILTFTPTIDMSAGPGGQDSNKFIQFGVMPQYGFQTLNLQPYLSVVKVKQDLSNVNRYDTDPQIAVFPLTKYDAIGQPTFTIHPYIPYQVQIGFDIDQENKQVISSVSINNMFKNRLRPQFTRWYFSISGEKGYDTGNATANTLMSLPFQVYPVGILQNPVRLTSTSRFDARQLNGLTAWHRSVNPSGSDKVYCLGRWSTTGTDTSFIQSLFGTTGNSQYGLKFVGQGFGKIASTDGSDNLQILTDFNQQDTDGRFKNIRRLGDYGPVGYNYLSSYQDMISQKRDGRIIRDTAQKKTNVIDKGLYISSPSNKSLPQDINAYSVFTSTWMQKIYPSMSNFYYGNYPGTPYNSVLVHMPWAMWESQTNKLLIAPIVVGPLRCSRANTGLYNKFATHSITGSSLSRAIPNQLGPSNPKAPKYKFGIAYMTSSGTKFYFDDSFTGLTGANKNIRINGYDYNFYSMTKRGTSAKLYVNNFPFAVVDDLSESMSGDLNANMTFNHAIFTSYSAGNLIYPGVVRLNASNVALDNLSVSGWRQELQFPVQMMDFSLWSEVTMQIAKLSNIIMSKKTGNVTLDYISTRKTITDDQNTISLTAASTDVVFDFNYLMTVTAFTPPTNLNYNSVSRISSYDVSVPFKVKGGKISQIIYDKGTKQGTPGFQYYVVTARRFLNDASILYVGQTATDHLNRMDNISQQKFFVDNYFTSAPGRPAFKAMWNKNSSFYLSNSALTRGDYRIGMVEDLNYSHCATTGQDYYTNVYSTLRQNFVYSTTGNYSQNWVDSRFAFGPSVQECYIQFKINVPISYFNSPASRSQLMTLTDNFVPYNISLYPSTAFVNLRGYPSFSTSSTSVSAFGYNGNGYRGYQKNVIYSYGAVTRSMTGNAVSTSAAPVLGGMWKALQTNDTLAISNISLGTGMKIRFEVV